MKRLITLLVAMTLLIAACSGDDSGEASTTLAQEATTTTAAETTTTTAAETTTTTTAAETTTTTTRAPIPTEPVVPGENADHDEIVDLFAVVFSGEASFEEKAPLIDDPTGLEATVEAYATASANVGGLSLGVTAVGVEGDAADVLYDLYFGENPFQTDQAGDAIRGGEVWQVTRAYFCSIMTLARVTCPAG